MASPLIISPLCTTARSIASWVESVRVGEIGVGGANLRFASASCAEYDDERIGRWLRSHDKALEK